MVNQFLLPPSLLLFPIVFIHWQFDYRLRIGLDEGDRFTKLEMFIVQARRTCLAKKTL